MKMPYRVRPLPKQPLWKVNDRQDLLDEMYDKLLGRIGEMAKGQLGVTGTRGRDMLPDEIKVRVLSDTTRNHSHIHVWKKWLAVTHKSFDHGRQGFNDRLAFLGKRLVDLQTSIALVQAPAPPSSVPGEQNVFSHPSLEGVENISSFNKAQILAPARVAQVARSFGVEKVVRWKPKKSDNLQGSGVDTVLAHTMYSIIGALALQRGGELAVRTVRERILKPLGLR